MNYLTLSEVSISLIHWCLLVQLQFTLRIDSLSDRVSRVPIEVLNNPQDCKVGDI